MMERMTEEEIAALTIRRTNRDGTAERLCSKAHAEITCLRADLAARDADAARLRAALRDALSYSTVGDMPVTIYENARAALSAWPNVTTTSWFENGVRKAVLNIPLPQEVSDEKSTTEEERA